jgi:VWFA-related protein
MIFALVLALGLADTAAPPRLSLDVVVHDASGRSVERLTPGDLAVTESGRPLPIESVRFVRASTSEPRSVAIFLDEFHVSAGPDADRIRETLTRFVTDALGPADRLAVLKPLDSLLEISVTTDRAMALAAIQSFTPRAGDLTARTAFERDYIASAPEQIVASRAQIATSSMAALTRALGALGPGRKTLIVVSDGFAARRSSRRADAGLPGFDAVASSANRAQVSIYPIVADQPAADANSPDATMRDLLARVASDTAGVMVPGERIADGLRAALEDASGYYEVLLAEPLSASGRLHSLTIASTRPGLVVRARSGYAGAPAVTPLNAAAAPRTGLPAVPRRLSPLIRPWFGMAPSGDGTTEISFSWEPAPRPAGERVRTLAPSRVALNVTAEDGRTLFEGTVLSAEGAGLATAPTRVAFSSPTGRVLVQMAIEDAASRVLDHDVRDLLVTKFSGPLALGTPEVLRARTQRERDTLAANALVAPVASRQFSRAERLLIRVPVTSASATPDISARLVSDLGSQLRRLEIARVPGRANLLQIDVPLASFAAGGYAVEILAREDGHEARERLAFRVTP